MTKNEIAELVNKFPTKYNEGFTEKERKSLVRKLGIDMKEFSSAFGINTGCVIEGECLSYHCDIENALLKINGKRALFFD